MSSFTGAYFMELENYTISKNRVFELISLQPVNIGNIEFPQSQQDCAIAIGAYAGFFEQGTCAIALGEYAGCTNQGMDALSIGSMAGQIDQSERAIAIGSDSGSEGQGTAAIAIGDSAGSQNQGEYGIAIGANSGQVDQGNYAIAIGELSGAESQGYNSVAIGKYSGNFNQNPCAVAIGFGAGQSNQGTAAIAIGSDAGAQNQGQNSIVIGRYAACTYSNSTVLNASGATFAAQSANSFYVKPVRSSGTLISGNYLMQYNPTTYEITATDIDCTVVAKQSDLTFPAGTSYSAYLFWNGSAWAQDSLKVHLGANAGFTQQSNGAIAIGTNAGYTGQTIGAIAIGSDAGKTNQANYSICIGAQSVCTYQNSTVINASGTTFAASAASALFVNPIRQVTDSSAYLLQFNTTTFEISASSLLMPTVLTVPKAHVTFTVGAGVISSTPYSLNVSSVSYISTGKFRVNFTSALSDTNYVVVVTCSGGPVGSEGGVTASVGSSTNLPLTTYFPITVSYYSGTGLTFYNPPRVCAVVF